MTLGLGENYIIMLIAIIELYYILTAYKMKNLTAYLRWRGGDKLQNTKSLFKCND